MSVIVLLILFSVIVALVFLGAFIWAVKSGQYDDTESPAIRILFEDRKGRSDNPQNSGSEKSK